MAKINFKDGRVNFKCPGCGSEHDIPVDGSRGWSFNGDIEKPTITPSILERSGHYMPNHKNGDPCWCNKDFGFECGVCHSFVTDGKIQFLDDCTHGLAGQTVELPEL